MEEGRRGVDWRGGGAVRIERRRQGEKHAEPSECSVGEGDECEGNRCKKKTALVPFSDSFLVITWGTVYPFDKLEIKRD